MLFANTPFVISIIGIRKLGIVNRPDNAEKKTIYPHIIAILFTLPSTEFISAAEKFAFLILMLVYSSFFVNKLSIMQIVIDEKIFVK